MGHEYIIQAAHQIHAERNKHTCSGPRVHILHKRTQGHVHAPTNGPNKPPPAANPHTHKYTHKHSFRGNHRAPYSFLLCPAFAVSKSVCTEHPVKLRHIKRDIREVNTTPWFGSGEGDKALFNRKRNSQWGPLVTCAEESTLNKVQDQPWTLFLCCYCCHQDVLF